MLAHSDRADLSVLREDPTDLFFGNVLTQRLQDEVVLVVDHVLILLGLATLLLSLRNGSEQSGSVNFLAVEGSHSLLGGVRLLESDEAVEGTILLLETGGSANDGSELSEVLGQEGHSLFLSLNGSRDTTHVHVVRLADVPVGAGLELFDHKRTSVELLTIGTFDARPGFLNGAELGVSISSNAVGVGITTDEDADEISELLQVVEKHLFADRIIEVLHVKVSFLIQRLGIVLLPVDLHDVAVDIGVPHAVEGIEGTVLVLELNIAKVARVIGVGVTQDVSLLDHSERSEDGEQALVTHVWRQVAYVESVVVVARSAVSALRTSAHKPGSAHLHTAVHHGHLHASHSTHRSAHVLHWHSLHSSHCGCVQIS